MIVGVIDQELRVIDERLAGLEHAIQEAQGDGDRPRWSRHRTEYCELVKHRGQLLRQIRIERSTQDDERPRSS